MFERTNILLVGGGKMGAALLGGWMKGGFSPETTIVVEPDPALREALLKQYRIRAVEKAEGIDYGFVPAVVVLAVKPQVMDEVLSRYAAFGWKARLFISIAAGRTVASIQKQLGAGTPVVRAMPNLPATIGKGISVAFKSPEVDAFQKEISTALLAAGGKVLWTEEEKLLDTVTAVSGSGPAYIYYFVEAMTEAALAAGLSADLARQLVEVTVKGSIALLDAGTTDAGALRKAVTSPGGTTEAALTVLMDQKEGLVPLLTQAMQKARKRAEELSS
jgi:pyrroline-5-carboxylate reductase